MINRKILYEIPDNTEKTGFTLHEGLLLEFIISFTYYEQTNQYIQYTLALIEDNKTKQFISIYPTQIRGFIN